MVRGKSRSSEKQKVSECSEMNNDRDHTRNKNTTTHNDKTNKGQDQGQDQGQSQPTLALQPIEQIEPKTQGSGIGEESAAPTVVSGTVASNEEEEDDNEEASEVWDIIRVIPTAEEKIECRYENCSKQAVAIWASDKAPDDKWSLCEECQLEDFGGWPEGVEPIERSDDITDHETRNSSVSNESECKVATPISTTKNTKISANPIGDKVASKDNRYAASPQENIKDIPIPFPSCPPPTASTSNQVEEGVEATGESFELFQVVSLEKLLGSPVECHDDACSLPACSIYTSTTDPKKWYYCLDCQERDFGGWPSSKELPCDYLEPEHLETISKKCSKKRNPTMPVFSSHCVTPLPKSPNPLKETASTSQKGVGKSKSSKFSASALARHEKWQADAKKLGVNRIIVKKGEAKKAIFDTLYDAFRPMNINDIYTTLKKMVPSPVLNAALEDMSTDFRDEDLFNASGDESNDDQDQVAPVKKFDNKEPYAGSLVFKAGKNAKSNLYYVDYTKIKEMDIDSRQQLASKSAIAKEEHERLTLNLKQAVATTDQLLSEPTNDELVGLLSESEEAVTKLINNVNDAKALMVNEGHKKKLKRQIQSMAGHYRKRKQLCCTFLSILEEVSDGTISKKKCLNGDGQIALDSDESTNNSAIAYAKSKKRRKTKKLSLADENFIGVVLDSQGMVKRVYVDDK